MKELDISNLLEVNPKELLFISGPRSGVINGVSTPEEARKDSLVFISHAEQINKCISNQVKVVIALKTLIQDIDVSHSLTLFAVENLKTAMGIILPLFDDKVSRFVFQIHPTAIIAPSARVSKDVKIGPYSVIGENTTINSDTIIGPHCIIENNAKIGKSSILHGFIFVGAHCEIGNSCEIHPHTTIGSDGFGFSSDKNYHHKKVPQIGKVVIEDNVEIGANCCFDRATIAETRIKSGTKIDNLCHIAHNCTIGENSLIAAGFFVAGSSNLGARFTTGGNSVVSTHINVCDGVTLAGRSTVTNDINEPGQYGGYPLQKLRVALKTIATIGSLVEMRRKISKISHHLNLKDD